MSAATEQQNNGDVAVEKVAADDVSAVKDDLKAKAAAEDKAAAADAAGDAADNGTSKDGEDAADAAAAAAPAKESVKGTKRPAEVSTELQA
ncbi:bacchus isoform X2 [Drosophila erecta]|uniref:bacchus isoform X2 n=1 Tax=Drosophila erecta TaxID=7220 RepID=UPI000F06590A|nr:bacchus isoform X2 [Drosophila erecta]